MKDGIGIWIDGRRAILVTISGSTHEIVYFGIGETEAHNGTSDSHTQHSYTPRDFQPEDRIERKEHAARKQMFNRVLDTIAGVERLLIMGPGETKLEFVKHIESRHFRNLHVEVETSDKLTDPQLAAKVRQYYAKIQC